MSSISVPEIGVVNRAFRSLVDTKCWALSNGKRPWVYDRGYGLTWSDGDLLLSFFDAVDLLHDRKTHGAGLGIFLGEQNRIACLDLDWVLGEDGNPITPDAAHIISGSVTYTEISVSGRGLHLFFDVPESTEPFHLKAGLTDHDGDFFTHKRFIRLTGRSFGEEHPIRALSEIQAGFMRKTYGKPVAVVAVPAPYNGPVSERSLASRLSGAGIPFKPAKIAPQPYHQEHGGIVECVSTECPNIKLHASPDTPNATFVRCADGLIAGRCFHQHCDPVMLRANGKSLAGMLAEKIRKAGDLTPIFQLIEKCESLGMPTLTGNQIAELGYPAVVECCEKFLKGVPA